MTDEVATDDTASESQASPPPLPTVVDVDSTWNGEGSLDEHRQKALEAVKQPGFGSNSDKAKARVIEGENNG